MDLKKVTFVCIDCETTGLDTEKDHIIEVAIVSFRLNTILDSFETLVDPKCPVPEESCKIHNITNEMLEGQPTIDQVLPQVFALAKQHIIVGHSINFDLQMLEQAAKRHSIPYPLAKSEVMDTLRLARLYGDSPNNSLQVLAKHFNIESGEAHRAMADVAMNVSVFSHLVRKFKTLTDLKKALARPIRMRYMPLGKYKGRLFSEIPINYLRWASTMDFDQDLLFSIRSELKVRKTKSSFQHSSNPFMNL